MIGKGYISEVLVEQRCYQIMTDDLQTVTLFFEEMEGLRLMKGDVLEFDMVNTTKHGWCALDPIKVSNKTLEDLQAKMKNKELVTAYVYGKNKAGYDVSYNGYRCFLPDILCNYQDKLIDTDETLLNNSLEFKVYSIKGSSVILSRLKVLKRNFLEMIDLEIQNMHVGTKYVGTVKNVVNYGLFITCRHTEGLLHVSRILNNYDWQANSEGKKALKTLIGEVFTLGREIAVEVIENKDNRYNLSWHKTIEPNAEICKELRLKGLDV